MTELYRYQKIGVRKIQQFNGNALLADDMGLGKSIQALCWATTYLERDAKILIICPASLKVNWQREARKHYGRRSTVLHGMFPTISALPQSGGIYIINYDILDGERKKKTKDKRRTTWEQLIRKWRPDLVIGDECHYIKTRNTKRTKATKNICKRAKHRIMISGTPLTNRPVELFSVLNILLPQQYNSFMAYAWRYCDPKMKPWGTEYKGASNLAELHNNLRQTCMIRRRKADVLKELPDKIHTTIPIKLSNRKEYDKAENDFIKWLAEKSPKKARKAENAEYLVKRGYLMRLAGELKIKEVCEWIENFMEETDEKLIFFGVHRNFLEPIYNKFQKIAVLVNGSTPQKKRQLAFDKFTKNRACRLFIGNIQAAGVGWNGQIASHVAFGELPQTPGELTQATDRAHRIGQKNSVQCHYLVSHDTIEELQCHVLRKKQEVMSTVLDGSPDFAKDVSIQVDQLLLEKRR